MIDWIKANVALSASLSVIMVLLGILISERVVQHDEGLGTTSNIGTASAYFQDLRSEKVCQDTVELPNSSGQPMVLGGTGAGCLTVCQSIPSGGLQLAVLPHPVAPVAAKPVVHGKRYLLSHHPCRH